MARGARDIQLQELKDTISQLNTTISAQTTVIVQLQKTLQDAESREAEHQKREAVLQEQIDYLTKKLFGASSERRHEEIDGQLSLFDEAEALQSDDILVPDVETIVKEHKRKAKTTLEEKLKGIPVEEVVVDIPDEDKICPQCGTPLEYIGKELIRRELEYIPAKVKVKEYVSYHYGCPECKNTDEPYIIKAKLDKKPLMKHSLASESSVAWTIYQKYGNALPLYRQEKDWEQYGIELSRTTLANWIIYCSKHYFDPLYQFFHRKLLERNFLMADETPVQVLNEPGRRAESKSYMWVYRTGEDGLPPIIMYGYSETRAGENAKNFLKGFEGYLECDGYQGYNKVPGITRCCCWAHVRRYLIDAIPKGKQYDYTNPAVQGVQYCNKLFEIEDSINRKKVSYEERHKLRLQKEQPVLEAFFEWLDSQNPVRNSRLDKAVNYINHRREFLTSYLEDGRCSFSNNASENAIRPFTVGRKNWLFSDSPAGATASATVYSIVEMAKAHELNIYEYIKYILSQRPSKDWTDEQLETIAPWNQDVIEKCKR
ncbi:IS66 family transposase [Pseudobutyrivibrio ruminis]|uniref:Transposase n=1 Tax=Pseudobutyrivibrio ruminis DSM 9787 TaxID=1123011 RepID=A0A285S8E0_9FIRM|nr:IS66 family transposase [Pseudobutyrivibrio ruminis]SOC03852.1 Transposase [Pseudobutyrivibrio ruminis DSM 9787]